MPRAGHPANPYAQQDPKPKIVDLLKLITPRQKSTYQNVSRSLKRIPGVHAQLNYYGKEWGWALRYLRGDATLCTLHFLPSKLEATITVTQKLQDWGLGPRQLSPATKRSLNTVTTAPDATMLRLPLGTPYRAQDLVKMVRFKVQSRGGPQGRIAGARRRKG